MFSLTQISLLEAETGDTSQPVYTSLWALFVPKSAKGPNLLSSPRPRLSHQISKQVPYS